LSALEHPELDWVSRGTHRGAVADLQRVDHDNTEHAKWVLVDWTLGTRCNFQCSYCPPSLHDGGHAFPPPHYITEFARVLAQHYRMLGRSVCVQFTGGEVSLYSQLPAVLAGLKDNGVYCRILSNGSRGLAYWSQLSQWLDSVTFTYHIEFAKWDSFCSLAASMSNRICTHVQFTMLPDRFEECLNRACMLREICPRVTLSLKPLRVGFGSKLYSYSAEQLAVLRKSPVPPARDPIRGRVRGLMRLQYTDSSERLSAGQILAWGLNQWRGWSCSAGLELLAINVNGDVYRALCHEGGCLGNVNSRVILPTDNIVCSRANCNCLADIMTTKVRAA
jgi:hypothetical protein